MYKCPHCDHDTFARPVVGHQTFCIDEYGNASDMEYGDVTVEPKGKIYCLDCGAEFLDIDEVVDSSGGTST